MEGGIDPDALLDYAEFEPWHYSMSLHTVLKNIRYEVCICSGNKVEAVESELLEQLLLHSPEVKNLDDYCC